MEPAGCSQPLTAPSTQNPSPLTVPASFPGAASTVSSRSPSASPHLSAVHSTVSEVTTSEIAADLMPSLGASKKCHCKRSKCLKLYCECFAANVLCDGCKCNNCENTEEYSESRRNAVQYKLARNRAAFDPKFKATAAEIGQSEYSHVRGCHCKRSNCRKKYCECFQAGIECSESCRCIDCANDGSLPHLRNFGVHDWQLPSMREATCSVYGVESVMMILPVSTPHQQDTSSVPKKRKSQKRAKSRKRAASANPDKTQLKSMCCDDATDDVDQPPSFRRKICDDSVDLEMPPDDPTPRSGDALIAELLRSPTGDEGTIDGFERQESESSLGSLEVGGVCDAGRLSTISLEGFMKVEGLEHTLESPRLEMELLSQVKREQPDPFDIFGNREPLLEVS